MCLALILILNLTMVNAYASSTYDRDAIKSVQSILNMWGYEEVKKNQYGKYLMDVLEGKYYE